LIFNFHGTVIYQRINNRDKYCPISSSFPTSKFSFNAYRMFLSKQTKFFTEKNQFITGNILFSL